VFFSFLALRPNRRRFVQTGCPGAARLVLAADGTIVVAKHTPCDGSHSKMKADVLPMPEGDELLELVAKNVHDGVSFVH
jgi:hypothetical protein